MHCQSCGKEIERDPVVFSGFHFCNNLCRRSFERGEISSPTTRKAPMEVKFPHEEAPVMNEGINFKGSGKENFYLALKVLCTLLLLGAACSSVYFVPKKAMVGLSMVLIYGGMIVLFFLLRNVLLAGYIRANAVLVSDRQFPEIYKILDKQAKSLKMKRVPQMYIMQAGGILNAFAMRYAGKHYVVIFSNIMETAYDYGTPVLSFIIGHELAHVKRNHLLKNVVTLPSILVPFLNQAYSRACEYTCDRIGRQQSPNGAIDGMSILAIGTKLFGKINVEEFAKQLQVTGGFCVWFSEILSSHPHISKRVHRLGQGA